jgi:signal transduction histidine kinase
VKAFVLLFASYVKRHLAVITAFACAAAVFSIVFSLYSLPAEAVIYASVLSMFTFCVIGVLRLNSYYKRHKILEKIKKSVSVSASSLPEPADRIESDYQEIIRLLEESRADAISKKDKALADMTDYYTMWAHQIKTPIAALRLLIGSERNTGCVPTDAYADEITEQLFKIEQYAEMVLGYLRTESMSGDLVIRNCRLDDTVRNAVKKYAKVFIRRKIPLYYRETDITVLTDEKWLCFVVEQILSNALKYTNKGKISIYKEDTGGPPALVIEDTGIGIRPEDLPRLGEKGFTGYNGHMDRKSTGIGLYLCKKILTKLSHEMIVESVVGAGTKVRIVFPQSDVTKM